jgi:uncharacterized membrane protein
MPERWRVLGERIREHIWIIPLTFAVVAAVIAEAMVIVDENVIDETDEFFLFGGGPESAREVLSTIASAMLTFTGLVFTITMLVLQLASNQLSPRVIRTFLRDRTNQVVLGLFVATFVHALVVLRSVRGDEEFVPALAVMWGYALLLVAVGAFIYYIDHMAHAIRASTVIASVGDETRRSLERVFPEDVGEEPEDEPPLVMGAPLRTVAAPARSGVLVAIDEDELLGLATGHDAVIEVIPRIGDFVAAGSPLFRIHGERRPLIDEKLQDTITTGRERSMEQDTPFGIRQLVDMAERALSPSLNDPTTAVQAIDQLHDILRRLATRRFPSRVRLDEDGRPRLLLRRPDWPDYVHMALDEIRQYGATSLQVMRRLRAMVEDLIEAAPEDRRGPLRDQLALLDASVERSFEDEHDRRIARDTGTIATGRADR